MQHLTFQRHRHWLRLDVGNATTAPIPNMYERVHFELEKTMDAFPLIDLWLDHPDCPLPDLERTMLQHFAYIGDPAYLANTFGMQELMVRSLLHKTIYVLNKHREAYEEIYPTLLRIDHFLRLGLGVFPFNTTCTRNLKKYGQTLGQVLHQFQALRHHAKPLPQLKPTCWQYLTNLFAGHCCSYLLQRLESDWRPPPPTWVDRSPRLHYFGIHHEN